MTFGVALKSVRGETRALEVAARALGPQSTPEARRDFANYLSRIERDKVPGVGLDRLRLIAKGLDLEPLSKFFTAIENAESSDRLGHSEFENKSLRSAAISDKDRPLTNPRGGSLAATPIPHDGAPAAFTREVIHEIASLLFAATAHTARQTPTPVVARPRSSGKTRRTGR